MMLGSYWWGQKVFPIHYPIQKMIFSVVVVLGIWSMMELQPTLSIRISGLLVAVGFLGWQLKKSLKHD
jgi:hypothetical protein